VGARLSPDEAAQAAQRRRTQDQHRLLPTHPLSHLAGEIIKCCAICAELCCTFMHLSVLNHILYCIHACCAVQHVCTVSICTVCICTVCICTVCICTVCTCTVPFRAFQSLTPSSLSTAHRSHHSKYSHLIAYPPYVTLAFPLTLPFPSPSLHFLLSSPPFRPYFSLLVPVDIPCSALRNGTAAGDHNTLLHSTTQHNT
jgi:hypothetical protein